MGKESELSGKNEYFEYVESRIEDLEKLILKKDDELKSLILKTVNNGASRNDDESRQNKVLIQGKGNFETVFKDIKEEEARFLKKEGEVPEYKAEELNEQLTNIEKREKMVQEMLDSLGTALLILKQRHEEVNRKEETLNREYKKLQEIEELYRNTGEIDNLESSFGNFSLGEGSSKDKRKTSQRKNSKE
ncbi:hypothetical protein [Acetobacterium bakii]|uniref:Uncharacterized protein n=1 Tax=Acetobacterium bakii TaxID=52689 RepID=A0A0L6U3H8_9FIRM|nr:hypothetical protein [Acetobacterium bakii]KNZ43073.1 hypothetical protein AKG39_02650 [Acetobacterium bakii]